MGLVYLRWEDEARQEEGYLANLSRNGAGLYVREALRPGQRVDIVVAGGEGQPRNVLLAAWVVWCRPLGAFHHAGLRFPDLGEHRYRDILRAYGFALDEWLRSPSPNADVNRVHEVLDQRLLQAVFQPIVDLRTGAVLAYEGLARCAVPGFENPALLYDAAASVGRIGELGWMFRRMAIELCKDHPLFLNLRPEEFGEGWLLQPDDPIFRHGHLVYLEITESDPLHYFEQVRNFLMEARRRGVRLAVDDLGAGYSNLRYIADLEPDVVKLDRGLVAGLTTGDRRFRLVKSIVSLCHEMGAKVVGEGIEAEGEAEAVIAAGADYGQGYLFARPGLPPPVPRFSGPKA